MWLKSEKNQYIMLSHISYFEVEPILGRDSNGKVIYPNSETTYKVVAYLDSQHILQLYANESQPRPAQISLYTGTEQVKCIRLFRPQFRKVKIRFVVEIP